MTQGFIKSENERLPVPLWAKKSRHGDMTWLPLAIHLADCAQAARLLWRDWVPEGVKRALAIGLRDDAESPLQPSDIEQARKLFIFLAAAHDLGKATPCFQYRPAFQVCPVEPLLLAALQQEGYQANSESRIFMTGRNCPHHSVMGQLLLEEAGLSKNAANVLGAHHGKPGSSDQLVEQSIERMPFAYGHVAEDGTKWKDAQQRLVELALSLSSWQSLTGLPEPDATAQLLLSALVIVADWIASAEDLFPLFVWQQPWEASNAVQMSAERAQRAWGKLELPLSWIPSLEWMQDDFFKLRFGKNIPDFAPRSAQQAAVAYAAGVVQPGILVLEAPMGSGKTETALAIAEIFAQKTERAGVFFALPTQATGDAMFARVKTWAEGLLDEGKQSIRLAHGKAQFNPDYLRLFEVDSAMGIEEKNQGHLIVHQWFAGQKKALLADFVVGTIDQLLLAALRQKHVMLRHLGLAGKVVIIDECHAYDAYMSRYLARALRWLGRYQVPVIVLSATLPAQRRKQVIAAYLGLDTPRRMAKLTGDWQPSQAYPLLTWTDGMKVSSASLPEGGQSIQVSIAPETEDCLPALLTGLMAGGGCVGIIRNTVKKAQQTAELLRSHFSADEVFLLHSRFLAPHRAAKEQALIRMLGKGGVRPQRLIVVGTQVLEQSLDIDFDLLVSDLCPMDLLLQRMGRLHRHERMRPESFREARCLILGLGAPGADNGPDSGSCAVYGDFLLARTYALLPKSLTLPSDIAHLVNDVYQTDIPLPVEIQGYEHMKHIWEKEMEGRRRRAGSFLLGAPGESVENLLDFPSAQNELAGQASVRDGDESIEVLLIVRGPEGLHVLEEGYGEICLHHDTPLDRKEATLLARQRLRLPASLCTPWRIQTTINELERMNAPLRLWQQSPWLAGELFLLMNKKNGVLLNGCHLCYDIENGLRIEESGDGVAP